ncbi:PilW family protein [Acidaminobacterium chupaoyuni]
MKRMKNNRGGFTLVELIVTIAIMGLVAIAVTGFMVTGAKSYSTVSYTLRLQMESQLAMTQMKEQIVDCNGGICWEPDRNALTVIHEQEDGTRRQRIFRYDSVDQCIYYGEGDESLTADQAQDLLAEHVTQLEVSFAGDTAKGHVKSAAITLTMKRGQKEYRGNQVIALRNKPLTAATAEELKQALAAK